MPSVYRFTTNSNATGTNVTGLNYVAGGYTFAFWVKFQGLAGDIIRQSSTANTARDGYLVSFTGSATGAGGLQVRHYTATTTTTYQILSNGLTRQGAWQHFALTYDGSFVRGYVDGTLQARVSAPNVPTANASCSTTMAPNVNGTFVGNLFDLQIILGGAVPEQAIKKLMDPTVVNPNLRARYFGREFVTLGINSTLRDESGSGNNLTTNATGRLDIDEEPPIRPTFA
jgi:hypothetical protein